MEIQAKLIQVLPVQEGESKTNGKHWKRQSFILETDGQYPKKLCIGLFGDDKMDISTLPIGSMLNVSFDLESREFNGRWYTDIRAWRVDVANGNAPTTSETFQDTMTTPQQPVFNAEEDKNGGLPF